MFPARLAPVFVLLAALCASCADDDTGSSAPPTAEVAPQRSTTTAGTPTTLPGTPTSAPPPLAEVAVELRTVAEVDSPTAMVPRTGTDDMYVAERSGAVLHLVANDDGSFDVDRTPVIDLTDEVADEAGERGLLGLAFSPDGGTLYVSYTDGNDDGASVIARYPMSASVADPAGRVELLRLPQPYPNHNGGNIVFGPDGYLYVGLGDGGSQGDPDDRGQDLGDLLGKLLRLDVSGDGPYRVPADNPFVGQDGARGEIWSYGLRNPWRFAFDRSTGDLWIADVGGSEWEEIDVVTAAGGNGRGANFGWSLREGAHATDKGGTPQGDVVDPVFEYGHDEGASITGGFVYRGADVPELTGAYLFSDFAAATLRAVRVVDGKVADEATIPTSGETMSQVSSFAESADGEVYVLNLTGEILRIDTAA